MILFFKNNRKLITYSLIFLMIIPVFGLNFLMSFIGNILILIFLIPLLLLFLIFLSFNSFKSKINTCNKCGSISIGSNICINCGLDMKDINIENKGIFNKPNESTIEIKAEEIN